MKMVSLLLFLFVSCFSLGAAEFEYPELLVVPRASKRLTMEAAREKRKGWKAMLPMQVSAVSTFLAGILQLGNVDKTKDIDSRSPLAGLVVGGGWLAANYYLGSKYRPYRKAHHDIKKLSAKSKGEQLLRERMAEEEINYLSRLATRVTWLSILTNAGASVYMASKVKSGSTSSIANLVAIAASFTPLIFSHRWKQVAREQKEYKKKIYSPIFSGTGTLLQEPNSSSLAPGILLSLTF